jgi:hypothetical protein
MSDPALILRRPQVPRKRGESLHEDYDVFDGDRDVGRIYLVHSADRADTWFWGACRFSSPDARGATGGASLGPPASCYASLDRCGGRPFRDQALKPPD